MKKLVPAIAMLLISSLLFSSATYAWFAMSQDVTIGTMQVQMTAGDQGIVISDEDQTAWGVAANAKYASAASLIPTSTIKLDNWWYRESDDTQKAEGKDTGANAYINLGNVAAINGIGTTNKIEGKENAQIYLLNKFYVKSSTAAEYDLSADDKTAGNLVIQNIKVSLGDAATYLLDTSLRVGIKFANTDEDDTVYIFAPVPGATKTYYVGQDGATATAVTAILECENVDTTIETLPGYNDEAIEVDVVVWFEGEDENLKTENITALTLDQLSVSVDLGITEKEYDKFNVEIKPEDAALELADSSASKKVQVISGGAAAFKLKTLDAGYNYSVVADSATAKTAMIGDTAVVTGITEDTLVSVVRTPKSFKVNLEIIKADGSKVTVAGPTAGVVYGNKATFTLTTGTVDMDLYDYKLGADTLADPQLTATSFTSAAITKNQTITIVETVKEFTVKATPDTGITLDPATEQKVKTGKSVTFKITDYDIHYTYKWNDGTDHDITGDSFTVENVTDDVTLTVSRTEKAKYTVSLSGGDCTAEAKTIYVGEDGCVLTVTGADATKTYTVTASAGTATFNPLDNTISVSGLKANTDPVTITMEEA